MNNTTPVDEDEFTDPAPPIRTRRDQIEAKIERHKGDGRYKLPHPETGKELYWTRVTTFNKSASDQFKISEWSQRMVAKGIGLRQDLYALAAVTPLTERNELQNIATQAKDAAAARERANLGTAEHAWAEQLDLGLITLDDVPEPWRADLAAYRQALVDHNVTILPEYVEQVAIMPQYGVAGTFDRVGRVQVAADVENRIVDLKTGRDLSYGRMEIACQLALYANAKAIWNVDTKKYEPMPEVSKLKGLVFHVPVGEGRCDVYEIDLVAGWEVADLCHQVRETRKRADKFFWPMATFPPVELGEPDPTPTTYEETVERTLHAVPDPDTEPTQEETDQTTFWHPDSDLAMVHQARTLDELDKVGAAIKESGRMTDKVKAAGKARRAELTQ